MNGPPAWPAGLEPPAEAGCYLLHLEPRYLHAGHYLGYARSIATRLGHHRAGGRRASPLLRAQLAAGGEILLARVWLGGDRVLERRMKNGGGLSRYCPICRAGGRYHR